MNIDSMYIYISPGISRLHLHSYDSPHDCVNVAIHGQDISMVVPLSMIVKLCASAGWVYVITCSKLIYSARCCYAFPLQTPPWPGTVFLPSIIIYM